MANQRHLNRLIDYLITIDAEVGVNISLQGQRSFNAKPVYDSESSNMIIGVKVTNLGSSPFLPMSVFEATIELLMQNANHTAVKGSARNGRLGDEFLPLDSVEGHVAHKVFDRLEGNTVLQRITPISRILEAAGICENGRGYLRLIV